MSANQDLKSQYKRMFTIRHKLDKLILDTLQWKDLEDQQNHLMLALGHVQSAIESWPVKEHDPGKLPHIRHPSTLVWKNRSVRTSLLILMERMKRKALTIPNLKQLEAKLRE